MTRRMFHALFYTSLSYLESMISLKMGGFIVAAFIAGAFIASPELRAYAANTVGSADIINNSILSVDIKDGEVKTVDLGNDAVTSAKIKNGEVKTDDIAPSAVGSLRIKDNDVKAQDIAPDAVGASELQGVTKLIYTECTVTLSSPIPAGGIVSFGCTVSGADIDDTVIATFNRASGGTSAYDCFALTAANPQPFGVTLILRNVCSVPVTLGTWTTAVIVYDT